MSELRGTARDMQFGHGDMLHVDGGRFVNCTFDKAIFIYSGGRHPEFEDCTFGDVGWRFEQEALRTIQLLQGINTTREGRSFIEDLFQPGKILHE